MFSLALYYRPLVDLIKNSRSVTVQVKAANALEAIATNNFESQKCFLELDAPKALQLLLKVGYLFSFCFVCRSHCFSTVSYL